MNGLIYTAVSNTYDLPRPFQCEAGVRAQCFQTNLDCKIESRRWNRTHKILGPMGYDGFDWCLYLDGSLRPKVPIAAVVESWLKDADLALMRHPHRDCAYAEVDACVSRGKIGVATAKLMKSKLEELGVPKNDGLFACGMIARRWPIPTWLSEMSKRWLELTMAFREIRDQVFLPQAIHELGFRSRIHVIEADIFNNPWFKFTPHGS